MCVQQRIKKNKKKKENGSKKILRINEEDQKN